MVEKYWEWSLAQWWKCKDVSSYTSLLQKKYCSLYLISLGLKSQFYWKGSFFSFRTFEQLLIHLQSLAELDRGEGGAGAPLGAPWDTNSGQSAPAWEWFKAHASPFCFVIWAPTILFNGTIWNLLPGPVGMFMDKTNNLLYNIKCEFLEGVEMWYYPSVENVCTGMLSFVTRAVLLTGWTNPGKCFL